MTKMIIGYAVLISTAIISLSCKKGSMPASLSEPVKEEPSYVPNGYQLVWQDEFNGTGLDSKKWQYYYPGSLRGKAYFREKNTYVDGQGNFVVEINKTDETYYTGAIYTGNTFTSKYGYYECRMKFQKQLGAQSAFWLMSSSYGKVPDDLAESGAEIDVIEYLRSTPRTIYHTIHWNAYSSAAYKRDGGQKDVMPENDDAYHIAALEWTPTEYVFYFDGKETYRTTKGVSQQKQHLILSAEITGWGGDHTKASLPDKVYFDYVRVYQKK